MSFKINNKSPKLMKKIILDIIGEGYHFRKNIKPVLNKIRKELDLEFHIIKKKNNQNP